MTAVPVYEKRGTSVTFLNTGGDKLLNARNLGYGAGRLSQFVDRGSGAAPSKYEIRAFAAWVASPTAGETLQVAVVESDGTHTDCGLTYNANGDASITQAAFNALPTICLPVIAHTADTAEKSAPTTVEITSRYYAIAVWNASAAKNLADSNGASGVIATPLYQEIQS